MATGVDAHDVSGLQVVGANESGDARHRLIGGLAADGVVAHGAGRVLVAHFVDYDPASGERHSRYTLRWDVTPWDNPNCIDAAGERMPLFWVIETDHPGAPIVDLIVRHRCNVLEPLGERLWNPSGRHRVVGLLEPGESATVDIPITWHRGTEPNDRFTAVLSDTPGFHTELLEVTEVNGKPTCRVRITPPADTRGAFVAALRVHATRHSAPFLVMGVVREPQ